MDSTSQGTPNVLVHGGRVIDGTGSEPFAADVLLSGDLILAVGGDGVAAGEPGALRATSPGSTPRAARSCPA